MEEERIILDWRHANHDPDRWDYTRALYAILRPYKDEILYIGKADGCTVKSRLFASDKLDRVLSPMKEQLGLTRFRFIVGEFRLQQRITSQLVRDIESLLILQINPWGNISNSKSRSYYRPGMIVFCQGDWPLQQKTFRDD